MQAIHYNTADWRKLYKRFINDYVGLERGFVIEPRVFKLSELVYRSNQGVSVYSCEGHVDDNYQGYIMFACKNREAAQRLTDYFIKASAALVHEFGWDYIPVVQQFFAHLSEEVGYPALTIRTPEFDKEFTATRYWKMLTELMRLQLLHYSAVSPTRETLLK